MGILASRGPAGRGLAAVSGFVFFGVLVGACAAESEVEPSSSPTETAETSQVEIHEIYGHPNADYLEMGVNSCNDAPVVEAVETDEEVALTVTVVGEPSNMDCQDQAEVGLDELLGDRVVLDTATGETLNVNRTGFGEYD